MKTQQTPKPARSLADLGVGDSAVVVGVTGDIALRRRLLELGVLPGTTIEVIRIAPLGDPMEVRLRGYSLSIRRDDARIVALEESAR